MTFSWEVSQELRGMLRGPSAQAGGDHGGLIAHMCAELKYDLLWSVLGYSLTCRVRVSKQTSVRLERQARMMKSPETPASL